MPLRGDPTGSGRLLVELLDMTSVITANIQVIVVVVVVVSATNSNFPYYRALQVEKESNKNKDSKVEEKMANGITIGTNYRVYAVQKVQTVAGEIVQLVHLKVLR